MSASGLCGRCDAVCCRLAVSVFEDDHIAGHLTEQHPKGGTVMARGDDGWCVALDRGRMQCSIYEARPAICRRFVMGGAYCLDERRRYSDPSGIALHLVSA